MYEDILKEKRIAAYGTALLPEGMSPFPNLRYALSFMVPLPKTVVESIKNGPTALYFHNYKIINTYLDNTAMQLVLDLRNEGYDALYVPASQSNVEDGLSSILSHKAVAHLAGLGNIGRNALFLSKHYGPAVRLSTVLTDMPLPEGDTAEDVCLHCNKCTRACPSGAVFGVDYTPGIRREELVDAKKCSIYMKKHFSRITRGDVCGMCIAACPLCYK